jgi:antitoxin HicB
MKKPRLSAETFDEFLAGQGILDDAEEVAIKRVLAWQIAEAMKSQGIAKTAMAARMQMDRRQLDRLLEPDTAPRRNGGGTQIAR